MMMKIRRPLVPVRTAQLRFPGGGHDARPRLLSTPHAVENEYRRRSPPRICRCVIDGGLGPADLGRPHRHRNVETRAPAEPGVKSMDGPAAARRSTMASRDRGHRGDQLSRRSWQNSQNILLIIRNADPAVTTSVAAPAWRAADHDPRGSVMGGVGYQIENSLEQDDRC